MKYLFCSFFAVLLLQVKVIAQSNFKPGLVVTTAGDTVRGFIDYKEWTNSPKSIDFKTSQEAKSNQEFNPNTARYVEITGLEAYEKFAGRISMDPVRFSVFPTTIDTSTAYSNVFLKVEQKGNNVVLLSFTDNIKTRYFLREQGSNVAQELGYTAYTRPGNKIFFSGTYKNQLWLAAVKYKQDSPRLKQSLELSDYSLNSLLRLVSKINGTTQANNKKDKPNFRFFAGAALSRSITKVKGDDFLAKDGIFKPTYAPKIGLGFDAFVNPNIQKLIIRTEITFTTVNADISRKVAVMEARREYNQIIEGLNAAFRPQVIYNFYNSEKWKLYGGAGLAWNIPFYQNLGLRVIYTDQNGETTVSDNENYYSFRKTYFTVPIRAGVVINRNIDLSLVYLIPTAITDHAIFAFQTSSLELGVNYLFNKKAK